MRQRASMRKRHDPRITYRGAEPSRIDNFTDAVFGLAVTLLVFNLANPNSFADLVTFTKTLPAFLVSISFLVILWNEHLRFSEIYGMDRPGFLFLNTLFVALIVFYVYPLRFLTLFLTNFFFQTNIALRLDGDQVPFVMVYYGGIAAALYFTLYLLYFSAHRQRRTIGLSPFEVFYTVRQRTRLVIMFGVPLVSIAVTLMLQPGSAVWASIAGGLTYILYTPAMILWYRSYQKGAERFE